MGLFNGVKRTGSFAKKAAVFTMVKMPLGILGWNTLKNNNQVIRDLWRSINAPICPECQKSVLKCDFSHREVEATNQVGEVLKTHYPYRCQNKECGYAIFATDDTDVRKMVTARSIERSKQRQAFLNDDSRAELIRGHVFKNRFFWACATLLFTLMIYQIAAGVPVFRCLGFMTWTIAAASWAIRFGYRAWQTETGTFFVEGAFKNYVINERWLR